ncbi:hypothetical protein TrLO_g79 [Triparma laevis f. longispina]|uniref:PUM-HD domain-containing protein n=2 Tax=Triparma laevis TaxID=1534972 RepID=A0A9W7CDP6_9STRA|nr:hypothetical protein TrLO_g79 [Triparma laevis f. longispina]
MAKPYKDNNKGKGGGSATGGQKRKSPSSSSSDQPSNSKRALKKERQSYRPNNEVVVSSKDLWNKLRLKTNSKAEIRELADSLYDLIKGKMSDLGKKHDASRIVQAMIQHGTESQRDSCLSELANDIPELSKQQYSHFIVLKLLKYCTSSKNKKDIVKSLKNQVVKLATHSVGARVVEVCLAEFSAKESEILKREFYGKQYAMFTEGDMSSSGSNNNSGSDLLKALVEEHPDQKESILKHVETVINKCLEKKLIAFAYVQDLLCQYTMSCSPSAINELSSSIVDYTLDVITTRPGAKAICQIASHSAAKERKRIMKTLKGYTRSSLLHRDAYIAIIRSIQVTDDTVTVQKMILNELVKSPPPTPGQSQSTDHPLLEIAKDANASKLLLFLLSEGGDVPHQYFDPWECDILAPAVNEKGESTSRKNPETRKSELLQFLKNDILKMVSQHAGDLIVNKYGGKVLENALGRWGECVEFVMAALEEEALADVFESAVGHLVLKRLLLTYKEKEGEAEEGLPGKMLEKFGDNFVDGMMKSSRGAFVLGALVEVSKEAKKKCKADKNLVKAMKEKSKGEKGTAGFLALIDKLK